MVRRDLHPNGRPDSDVDPGPRGPVRVYLASERFRDYQLQPIPAMAEVAPVCAANIPRWVFDEETGKQKLNPIITPRASFARMARRAWRSALERVGLWKYGSERTRASEERELCRIERRQNEIDDEVTCRLVRCEQDHQRREMLDNLRRRGERDGSGGSIDGGA